MACTFCGTEWTEWKLIFYGEGADCSNQVSSWRRFAASVLEKRTRERSIPHGICRVKQSGYWIIMRDVRRGGEAYRGHRYEPHDRSRASWRRTNSFPRVGSPLFGFISSVKMPRVRLYVALSAYCASVTTSSSIDSHFPFFFLSLSLSLSLSCLHICVCIEPSIAEDFNKISNTAVDRAEKILWILCQVKHQLLLE